MLVWGHGWFVHVVKACLLEQKQGLSPISSSRSHGLNVLYFDGYVEASIGLSRGHQAGTYRAMTVQTIHIQLPDKERQVGCDLHLSGSEHTIAMVPTILPRTIPGG